ncbi:MAG: efflux transporter periplasmic adaptor subunit [Sphingomonas sp. 28-66-16]|nr:MAG: efflux transporter periplasmic adaptor subunit [Sphingomonas sp. 28-66-16]
MTRSLLLILTLMLAGCSAGGEGDSPADPVALVSLGRAEQGVVTEQVTLFGTAEAGATGKQTLAAPADAVVTRIIAPVGTRVRRGDVIVALSPAPATRLDIVKAATDARAADAAFARAQRLRADGLASDAEVENARAAAASANATRTSLSGRAGALTLRALAPGYVETVPVSPGELVTAGTAIATIGRPDDVRARFGADPAIIHGLRRGAPIRIVPSAGRAPLTVPVESIDSAVDPQTRLASVFARLPATAGIALGETLQAHVDVGASSTALTIPYAALLDDGGQPFVYVAKGGIAHRHDVETGPATGDRIAIVKGLAAGDRVVTQGGTALEDGMKVRTK